jgi:hypothetical protein
MARHGLYEDRENNRARGANVTSASSGKIGRRQRVWPSIGRLVLVLPGASALSKRAHHSPSKMRGMASSFVR